MKDTPGISGHHLASSAIPSLIQGKHSFFGTDVGRRYLVSRAKGRPAIELAPAGKGEGLAQSSILVVEDEVLIRLHLAEELRAAGYTVVEATDSQEAMTVLRSLNDIGLVVTDIRMPGNVDGLALGRWIRAKFPEIKIVLVSAEFRSENSTEFDAGFTKPVRIADLLRRVRQLLPQAEQSGSQGR